MTQWNIYCTNSLHQNTNLKVEYILKSTKFSLEKPWQWVNMFDLNTTRETMALFLKPFYPNPKAKQTIITLQNQHQEKKVIWLWKRTNRNLKYSPNWWRSGLCAEFCDAFRKSCWLNMRGWCPGYKQWTQHED